MGDLRAMKIFMKFFVRKNNFIMLKNISKHMSSEIICIMYVSIFITMDCTMNVCKYLRMLHARMYVWTFLCVYYERMYVCTCTYVRMCSCTYVRIYVCRIVRIGVSTFVL